MSDTSGSATGFHAVDLERWERQEYYAHYMHKVRCTYSVTVNLDITGLKAAVRREGKRIYPAQIHMLAHTVNRYREFRMAFDAEGVLGCWDERHPAYTVFNKERETFSSLWTPYCASFGAFHEGCVADMERYADAIVLHPKPGEPANTFPVSCLPWAAFTGFNINAFTDGTYLAPIFTIGKFVEQDGRVLMPLAIQAHHAVCDGFHVGRFVTTLQERADRCDEWLCG